MDPNNIPSKLEQITGSGEKPDPSSSDSRCSGIPRFVMDEGSELGEVILNPHPARRRRGRKERMSSRRQVARDFDTHLKKLRSAVDKILEFDSQGGSHPTSSTSNLQSTYKKMLEAVKGLRRLMFDQDACLVSSDAECRPHALRSRSVADTGHMRTLSETKSPSCLELSLHVAKGVRGISTPSGYEANAKPSHRPIPDWEGFSISSPSSEVAQSLPSHPMSSDQESTFAEQNITSTDSEVTRLNTELSQRNLLIQYLSEQLCSICQANDRLFADYESQETSLTDQLHLLRSRLAEATQTLRHSSGRISRDLNPVTGRIAASAAVILLEFVNELKVCLSSLDRTQVELEVETLRSSTFSLLHSWQTANPSELTYLFRSFFGATLALLKRVLTQKTPSESSTVMELEIRARYAEEEVERLSVKVNDLTAELEGLKSSPSFKLVTEDTSDVHLWMKQEALYETPSAMSTRSVAECSGPSSFIHSSWSDGAPPTTTACSMLSSPSIPRASRLATTYESGELLVVREADNAESSGPLTLITSTELSDLLERLQGLLVAKEADLSDVRMKEPHSSDTIIKGAEVDVLDKTCDVLARLKSKLKYEDAIATRGSASQDSQTGQRSDQATGIQSQPVSSQPVCVRVTLPVDKSEFKSSLVQTRTEPPLPANLMLPSTIYLQRHQNAIRQLYGNVLAIRNIQADLTSQVHFSMSWLQDHVTHLVSVIRSLSTSPHPVKVPSTQVVVEEMAMAEPSSSYKSVSTTEPLEGKSGKVSPLIVSESVGLNRALRITEPCFGINNGTTKPPLNRLHGSEDALGGEVQRLNLLETELNAANAQISTLTSYLLDIKASIMGSVPPREMVSEVWENPVELPAIPQLVRWYIQWVRNSLDASSAQLEASSVESVRLGKELESVRDNYKVLQAEHTRSLNQLYNARMLLEKERELSSATGARASVAAELEAQTVALISTQNQFVREADYYQSPVLSTTQSVVGPTSGAYLLRSQYQAMINAIPANAGTEIRANKAVRYSFPTERPIYTHTSSVSPHTPGGFVTAEPTISGTDARLKAELLEKDAQLLDTRAQLLETQRCKDELASHLKRLQGDSDRLQRVKDELSLSEVVKNNLQSRVGQLETLLSDKMGETNELAAEVEALRTRLASQTQHLSAVELNMAESKATNEHLCRVLQEIQSTLSETEERLSSVCVERERLIEQVQALESEFNGSVSQLEQQNQNYSQLRVEYSDLQLSYQSARHELEEKCLVLSEQVETLQAENLRLKNELAVFTCPPHPHGTRRIQRNMTDVSTMTTELYAEVDKIKLAQENERLSTELNRALEQISGQLEELGHRDVVITELQASLEAALRELDEAEKRQRSEAPEDSREINRDTSSEMRAQKKQKFQGASKQKGHKEEQISTRCLLCAKRSEETENLKGELEKALRELSSAQKFSYLIRAKFETRKLRSKRGIRYGSAPALQTFETLEGWDISHVHKTVTHPADQGVVPTGASFGN
ncbi:unnamed protein product [Calicophoron daubneyi]|uniref:Uncharacterized protein n=1 Tax=Calicophoron daubneyi TaxID=300641 RepID=A0AAV2TQT8_CALDB